MFMKASCSYEVHAQVKTRGMHASRAPETAYVCVLCAHVRARRMNVLLVIAWYDENFDPSLSTARLCTMMLLAVHMPIWTGQEPLSCKCTAGCG